MRDQSTRRAGWWPGNNSFQPAGRRTRNVICGTRSMVRVVPRDGHSIHRDDFKRLPLKLQVHVAIGRSIYDTPELAFARCDFNLRPYRAVHRHDLFWRLWLATTSIRTEVHALFQFGGLCILPDGTPANHQHTLG